MEESTNMEDILNARMLTTGIIEGKCEIFNILDVDKVHLLIFVAALNHCC